MPFAKSMAKTGTRFNNSHVTAVCAPTRACLFTGRNAHSVGVRCSENRHAPISRAYQPPFVFDQTLNRVTINADIG